MEPQAKLLEFALNPASIPGNEDDLAFSTATLIALDIAKDYPGWLPVSLTLEIDGTWIFRLSKGLDK